MGGEGDHNQGTTPDTSQHITVSGGSVGQAIGQQVDYYAAEGRPPDRDRLALISRVDRCRVQAYAGAVAAEKIHVP